MKTAQNVPERKRFARVLTCAVFVFVSLFFVLHRSWASEYPIYSQLDRSSNLSSGFTAQSPSPSLPHVLVTKVKFWARATNSLGSCTSDTTGGFGVNAVYDTGGGGYVSTSVQPWSSLTNGWQEFTATLSGTFYADSFTNVGVGAAWSVPDCYSVGIVYGTDGTGKAAVRLFGNSLDGASINWSPTTPISGGRSVDFTRWSVCINFEAVHVTKGFYVNYVVVGGDTPIDVTEDNSDKVVDLPGSTYIGCQLDKKQTNLGTGKYLATAYLYDQDGTVLGNTDTISFQIVDGTQVEGPPVYETSLPAAPKCTNSNAVARSFCEIMQFLFYPSKDVTSGIAEERDQILTKFPFAYVTDVSTAVSSGLTTSASTPEYSVDLTGSALPIDVPIFSESKITEYAGSENVTLFRGLMAGALWIGFGLFVFHTIRRLH